MHLFTETSYSDLAGLDEPPFRSKYEFEHFNKDFANTEFWSPWSLNTLQGCKIQCLNLIELKLNLWLADPKRATPVN